MGDSVFITKHTYLVTPAMEWDRLDCPILPVGACAGPLGATKKIEKMGIHILGNPVPLSGAHLSAASPSCLGYRASCEAKPMAALISWIISRQLLCRREPLDMDACAHGLGYLDYAVKIQD